MAKEGSVVVTKTPAVKKKTGAKKKTAAKKRTSKAAGKTANSRPRAGSKETSASPEGFAKLHDMIAEAAYYRAEQRGFQPGAEVDDWLWAEQQIIEHTRQ